MKQLKRALCLLLLLTLLSAAPALADDTTTTVTSSRSVELAIDRLDWTPQVVKMDWFDGGSEVLEKDDYGYIYDIDTGITVRIKRMGGHNHADVEPATREDTEKLLEMSGGKFSWDSRAVVLISDGQFVAAAINTKPHGQQTIRDNDYRGQFCLHTTNSITHGSHRVNKKHMEAIDRAYQWCQWNAMVKRIQALGATLDLM